MAPATAEETCANAACGAKATPEGKRLSKCSACPSLYCSKECLKADWPRHQLTCPKFQRHPCWICNEVLAATPVHRACGCRGDKGFAHIQCLIDNARDTHEYSLCVICGEAHYGEIRNALASAAVGLKGISTKDKLNQIIMVGNGFIQDRDPLQANAVFRGGLEMAKSLFGENFLVEDVSAELARGFAMTATQVGKTDEAVQVIEDLVQTMNCEEITWKAKVKYDVNTTAAGVHLHGSKHPHMAFQYAEKALDMAKQGESDVDKINAAILLSDVYTELGDHDKAVQVAKDGRKLAKKRLSPSHPLAMSLERRVEKTEEILKANRGGKPGRKKKVIVTLQGFSGDMSDLNGTRAEVLYCRREKGLYEVRFPGEKDTRMVKPENVVFKPGTKVVVYGLKKGLEFNFKEGIVKEYVAEHGRFSVNMWETDETFRFKPENIVPA